MSNNNAYWGKRFGSVNKGDGTNQFTPRQLGSGPSVSGPHQVAPVPGSPRDKQARADAEAFRRMVERFGRPVKVFKDGAYV